MFHTVIGYDIPVVSGILRTRTRAIMSMGCETYGQIEAKLQHGIEHPIEPGYAETAPNKEVVQIGDAVDLFRLPIPMSSIYDGGPMITAGVVIAKDAEFGFNSGMYRFMVKEKNLTGIDIVTPNNMRLYAQRAYEAWRPSPISLRSVSMRWQSPAVFAEQPSSLQCVKRSICPALRMPKSFSRPKSCRPAGAIPKAASVNSRA